ncbi:hypothetical protein AX15_007440 [Amanita polypyramis BW_CC]|nr:hypothetical protein AX15_007440 [Amanita polypyramis BW_CC]
MALVLSLLSPLLLASLSSAYPFYGKNVGPSLPYSHQPKQATVLNKCLRPPTGSTSPITVRTPIGVAEGIVVDATGTARFSVQYATADRWEESTVAATWNLPTANVTGLPLPCPQPGLTNYTENCLSMILYVPRGIQSCAATLIWLPGGSFILGSATDAGLNGSKLAVATNSIVAVIQHRLGALGFMSPDGKINLAVKDVINAMSFINTVVPSFGGGSAITLAGQSSGANMIRALLATPSASSLFKSGILHSDPMDYGFLSSSTQQLFQRRYNSLINCTSSDTGCWNSLSLETIIDTQMTLFFSAAEIDPSAGSSEPIRPVRDGSLITSSLDSTTPFPSVSKPLMISTVSDEAGPAIYSQFPDPVSESALHPICNASLGPVRTSKIINSTFYTPITPSDGTIDARSQLESLGTDMIWRCSSWTFARNWVQHGGRAYVGVYTVGATYSDNADIPFCTQSGSVCHQDDIMIVFGTVPNPSPAQSSLILEVQRRYKAFIYNDNPNTGGLATWNAATSSIINAYNLGGQRNIAVGACEPSFWGQSVQYDYQIYDI